MILATVSLMVVALSGCSEYSAGWQSHPSSAYPVNDNDMYLTPGERRMQAEKASGVKTNDESGSETVWIWQREFWSK